MPVTGEAVFRALADFNQLVTASKTSATALDQLGRQAVASGQITAEAWNLVAAAATKATEAQVRAAASSIAQGEMATAGAALAAANRGVSQSVNEVEQSLQRGGLRIDEFGQKMSNVARGLGAPRRGLASVEAAVALVGAAVVGMGLKFDSFREQSQVAFSNILNDGPKAAQVINNLVEVARVTPFITSDLTSATRTMLAFGIPMQQILQGAGRDAKGLLITVGDAASAMGSGAAGLERISRVFGQINTQGTVNARLIRELTMAGIPAYAILQEKLGLTAAQMQNIGQLGISSQKAIDALAQGINEKFGGAMEEQSHTLAGLFSTLKDNVQIFLGEAEKPLFDRIKTATDSITQSFSKLDEEVNRVGFGKAFAAAFPIVAQVAKATGDGFHSIGEALTALMPLLKAFVESFTGGVAAGILVFLRAMAMVLGIVASAISAIPEPAREFLGIIAGIVVAMRTMAAIAAFTKLSDGIQLAITGVQSLIKWIKSLQVAVETEAAVEEASSTRRLLTGLGGAITGGARGVASRVGGAVAGPATGGAVTAGVGEVAGAGAGWNAAEVLGLEAAPALSPAAIPIGAAAIAVAAVGAGMIMYKQHLDSAYKSQEQVTTGAQKLAASFNIEQKSIADVNKSLEDNVSKSAQAGQNTDEVAKQNTKLIKNLRDLNDEAARAKLTAVGIDIVQHGGDPQKTLDALNQIQRAAYGGIKFKIDSSELTDFQQRIKNVDDQARAVLDDIAKGDEGRISQSRVLTEQQRANIDSLAKAASASFTGGNVAEAIAQISAYDQTVKGSNLSLKQQQSVMEELSRSFVHYNGISGISLNNTVDLQSAFKEMASGSSNLSQNTKDLITQILKGGQALGGDYYQALINIVHENPNLGGGVDLVNKALAKQSDDANQAAHSLWQYTMTAQEAGDKLDQSLNTKFAAKFQDMIDPQNVLSDLVGAFNQADTTSDSNAKKARDKRLQDMKQADAAQVAEARQVLQNQIKDENQAMTVRGQALQDRQRDENQAFQAHEQLVNQQLAVDQRLVDSATYISAQEKEAYRQRIEAQKQALANDKQALDDRHQAENDALDREKQALQDSQQARQNALTDREQMNQQLEQQLQDQNQAIDDNEQKTTASLKKQNAQAQISLKSFGDALAGKVSDLQNWSKDLQTVAGLFGPDIAKQLQQLGPSFAGIVSQMARDSSGQGKRVAELLKQSFDLSQPDYAENQRKIWDIIGEINTTKGKATLADINQMLKDEGIRMSNADIITIAENYGNKMSQDWAKAQLIAASGADNATKAVIDKLASGGVQISAIMQQYAQYVANGLNPVLVAVGQDVIVVPQITGDQATAANIAAMAHGFTPTDYSNITSDKSSGLTQSVGISPIRRVGTSSGVVGGGARLTAAGDIIDPFIANQPTVLFGEAGYPEAFLSFDPSKRGRTQQLWQEVGKRLGFLGMAAGGFVAPKGGFKYPTDILPPIQDHRLMGADWMNKLYGVSMIRLVHLIGEAAGLGQAKGVTPATMDSLAKSATSAMTGYGLIPKAADVGGFLHPGWNLTYNGTGGFEPVFPRFADGGFRNPRIPLPGSSAPSTTTVSGGGRVRDVSVHTELTFNGLTNDDLVDKIHDVADQRDKELANMLRQH